MALWWEDAKAPISHSLTLPFSHSPTDGNYTVNTIACAVKRPKKYTKSRWYGCQEVHMSAVYLTLLYNRSLTNCDNQTIQQAYSFYELKTVVRRLTWPPLVVEKILIVPPHCLTYQRNHRAETSWGSEVTFTLTNRVAKRRAALQAIRL